MISILTSAYRQENPTGNAADIHKQQTMNELRSAMGFELPVDWGVSRRKALLIKHKRGIAG
jgi:hypothetical protein